MNTIHWGIIGCGDVTEVKSGPGFQKAAGSELVAVMRRDAAKAADYARRHGVAKWYDDANKLIADPCVDAVYIATPPSLHEPFALRVCQAGKPCYVEKPMARSSAEAARMVDAFAARGIPLFVAYYRRALPRFVRARQIIQGGTLGSINAVSYRYLDSQMSRPIDPIPWRLVAEESGGGLFLDLGSHVLDLLDFFLGPLATIAGLARNAGRQFDVEDQVELTFTAKANVSGKVSFDFAAHPRQDRFTIEGDKGNIQFSCFGTEPLEVDITGRPRELVEVLTPAHVQQPLIQAVVDSLRGSTTAQDWLSSGAVALRTQRVMDQAVESYYGGREDGFWRRKRI